MVFKNDHFYYIGLVASDEVTCSRKKKKKTKENREKEEKKNKNKRAARTPV